MNRQISTKKGLVVMLGAIVVFSVAIFIIDRTGIRLPSMSSNETKTEIPAKATSREEINKRLEHVKVVAYPKKAVGTKFEYRFDVLNQSEEEFNGKIIIRLYKSGHMKDGFESHKLNIGGYEKEKILTEATGDYNGFNYKLVVDGSTINRSDVLEIR